MQATVKIKNKSIPINWIEDICPHKKIAILKTDQIDDISGLDIYMTLGIYTAVNVEDEEQFRMIKFELIKQARNRSKPIDRVFTWEANDENNVFSLNKYERLVEARKTPSEKKAEKMQEILLHKLFNEHGLTYRRLRWANNIFIYQNQLEIA